MNALLNTGLHVTGGTSPSFITNAILIFITMAMETAFCRTISGYTTKKGANKHKELLPTKKKMEEAEWLSILSAGLATEVHILHRIRAGFVSH